MDALLLNYDSDEDPDSCQLAATAEASKGTDAGNGAIGPVVSIAGAHQERHTSGVRSDNKRSYDTALAGQGLARGANVSRCAISAMCAPCS